MRKTEPILPVLIGPPGVGKTTISDVINNRLDSTIRVLDGDSFISEKGIARLQANTWDDSDRFNYLASMAEGAIAEIKDQKKIVLIDAMTTRWMRQFFTREVKLNSDITLKWVEVSRHFQGQEVDILIEERRQAGHPINSLQVFERFTNQFEPLEPPFERLVNPGSSVSFDVLEERIWSIMDKLYENTI